MTSATDNQTIIEKAVEQLKDYGQYIVDNAETIVSDIDKPTWVIDGGIRIAFTLLDHGNAPNRTTELLPCPFCGGEAAWFSYANGEYDVKCRNAMCLAKTCRYATEAEAIAAWNTRTERTCHNLRDDEYFECSECDVETSIEWCGSGYGSPKFCPNCGARVVER